MGDIIEERMLIKSVSDQKETAKGLPMWTIETSKGRMSCFDEGLANELSSLVGMNTVIAYELNGIFKNLKGVGEGSAPAPKRNNFMPRGVAQHVQPQYSPSTPQRDYAAEDKSRMVSICIGYSKDLAVAGKITIPEIENMARLLLGSHKTLCEEEIIPIKQIK